MNPETVLCSRTDTLPASWLPEAGAVPLAEVELLSSLSELPPVWMPRPQAEHDPTFKQWIPYVILKNAQESLAVYTRCGTETRLYGRWSLGIGGHVNPADADGHDGAGATKWRSLLWNGLRRELGEEYPGARTGRTKFLGLIHESRSAVGRVHIGAVFIHEPTSLNDVPGSELFDLRWLDLASIGSKAWPWKHFELWSRLAVKLLPA
ncbi:MAG: hypothetical protein M2R45_03545 [Verrucomicrobia subdivision 3 bacterium]|nr:hypothetical protein [Limisphaerales bacterium]MCS1416478.1 hypothetical protein [Limisphaerales bacterium]